jgi:hypothetical protein
MYSNSCIFKLQKSLIVVQIPFEPKKLDWYRINLACHKRKLFQKDPSEKYEEQAGIRSGLVIIP